MSPRLVLVDALKGEADVNEHPVSGLRLRAERERDLSSHARQLRLCRLRLAVDELDDLGGNR